MKILIPSVALCLAMHLPSVPYVHTIQAVSCDRHINPRLVIALIQVESSFRRRATRKEPDGTISYGLLQVKSDTARMLGMRGPASRLYSPYTNVLYGVRYIRMLAKKYRTWASIVSAYNCGTAHWYPVIGYTNQPYVNKVLIAFRGEE